MGYLTGWFKVISNGMKEIWELPSYFSYMKIKYEGKFCPYEVVYDVNRDKSYIILYPNVTSIHKKEICFYTKEAEYKKIAI